MKSALKTAKASANMCDELFRKMNKPQYAVFSALCENHIDKANASIRAAHATISEVCADGVITSKERPALAAAMMTISGSLY